MLAKCRGPDEPGAAGLHLLSCPPGIFMLLLIFFAFLHCWLNAFAEMLRFGDRMFYRVRPGRGAHWGQWFGRLTKGPGKRVAGVGVTFSCNKHRGPQGVGMMPLLSAAGLTALGWVECQGLVSEWLEEERERVLLSLFGQYPALLRG